MEQHVALLQRIAALAGSVLGQMRASLAAVECALLEAGLVTTSWTTRGRAVWHASLAAAPAGDMHSVLLHTAALQAGLLTRPHTLLVSTLPLSTTQPHALRRHTLLEIGRVKYNHLIHLD